jgi:DNA polymerase III subunit beta
MDITVKQSRLLRELQHVQGVVERKTTVPILSNILLEAGGNSLVITATDLDVSLKCTCPAEIRVAGAVTLSARKLFDIVRLLPEAEIHFKAASPDWVNLNCQRSRFKIAGLSKENFPDVPSIDQQPVLLSVDALAYIIPRSIFAITTEESRYTLNGALMIVDPARLTFVTTDGHRLVHISHLADVPGVEGETRVLVPKKALVELSKLTGEADGTVEFGSTQNHLFFRAGERHLVSRLLTGQFPNYDRVIPRENDLSVTVNTVELAQALRRVAVMADDQSKAVRLSLKEGQLEVSSASPDFGEAKETVSVRYSGNAMEIGFNAFYLLDFLSTLESEEVIIRLKDKETQALLAPAVSEGFEYSYVVMPIKI